MASPEPVKTWPARYKADQISVHESHRHQIWIDSRDIRRVIPALRSDKLLEKEHSTDFRQLDSTKRLFINERALKHELNRIRTKDALMFLAWLDKQVYYPAARKRGDAHTLELMPKKARAPGDTEEPNEDLHIPARKVVPPVKPVLPLTPPIKKQGAFSQWYGSFKVIRFWRGQYDVLPSLLLGGVAMVGWTLAAWALLLWTMDPAHYSGNFAFKQWLVVILLPALPGGVIWWCVGVMRSAMRGNSESKSLWLGGGSFVLCACLLTNAFWLSRSIAQEWLSGWIRTVFDDLQTAEVVHDPILGRITVKGDTGFGSYQQLEIALRMKPRLTLVEFEGPGGYVVEGLAMARLIRENQLDTVVMGECASICTVLLAAGNERYLGPKARLGFHRSGISYVNVSKSWTATDHKIADFYLSRNTSEDFVKQALDTPFNSIWEPDHGRMFSAGYATKRWDERKPGY